MDPSSPPDTRTRSVSATPLGEAAPSSSPHSPSINALIPLPSPSHSAYSGSYSIYKALAIALNTLDPNHKPDYTNTHPPFDLPPQPSWFDPKKIVSLDPWGHYVQTVFKKEIDAGLDARPTSELSRLRLPLRFWCLSPQCAHF